MRHDHRVSIEAKLTPAELAYIRVFPPHTWRPGAPQLRDYAIRDARDAVAPGRAPTPAARCLADELARYVAAAWRFEAHMAELSADAPAIKRALHRALRLSDGKPIGWRRIFDICLAVDLHDAEMTARSCIRTMR